VQETVPRRSVQSATKNSRLVRDRRDQLIRAALEVFSEKGFHEATVRDIGRAANLTQGTIYNYVRSKEDILFLVCDRIVTEYLDKVREAIVNEGDPRARLRAAVKGIVRVMQGHKEGILLLYHESHNLDSRSLRVILARVDEFIKSFEHLLAEANIEGLSTKRHLRLFANILTFLPTIVALRGWALPLSVSDEEIVDELAAFMLRGSGA
jgi:AcrR family transcriptional regulator